MKFKDLNIPNKYSEAKTLLDYKIDAKDQNNYVYINLDKVSAYYLKSKELMKQLTEDLKQILFDETGEYINFNPGSRNDIIYILTDMLKIPESKLMKHNKISITMETMLRLSNDYNTPFIHTLMKFTEHKTFSSGLKYYYENVTPIPNGYNNEGDRIGKIRTAYRLNETYRMSTYDPHIQGINLSVSDIITAPVGWVIVQVDSGQIEPRIYYSTVVKDPMITWLIEQYDDVYFALSDYCLRDNTDFVESNLFLHGDVDKKHRSTLKTLVNAGTYGATIQSLKTLSAKMYEEEYFNTEEGREKYEDIKKIGYYQRNMNNEKIPEKYRREFKPKLEDAQKTLSEVHVKGWELAEKFFSRILQHPQRIRFENEIENEIKMGGRKVTSPFGDERIVYGDFNYIKRCFLNNPLQMAVSRLSAISVCEAFEFINSNEKLKKFVRYCFMKHDEDVYYVRKEVAEEVAKELKKFREYEVDNWIPIKSDYTIGLDYKK